MGKRPVPTEPVKDRREVIQIEPSPPRLPPQERGTRRHHSRDRDMAKGRRRHPKHRGNRDE
jgi:hypothetical protein